jgi:hypothetical protein
VYERHQPEHTLLYRVISEYYPRFLEHLASEDRPLPTYVRREFTDYLRCGRLEYGFLILRCQDCHAEKRVAFSCKRRGFCPSCGARRMVESAALLVDEVIPHVPIRQWVLSVPYPLRFLYATHAQALGECLTIVYRAIESFLIKKAGLTRGRAQGGAVTLIQRFGSALNLNVHLHMLIPDGVWLTGSPRYFRQVTAPTVSELQGLLQKISARIGRHLERVGLLVRDEEHSYLDTSSIQSGTGRRAGQGRGSGTLEERQTLEDLQSHSITYRIAVGAHRGRKAFMLQSLPPMTAGTERPGVAQLSGFSLHAGVAAAAHQRYKLERLARYITRPVLALERLSLTAQGHIRYGLKTPYRDGTTHVIFEPLDFLARLASLVPLPRVNLTRFHGVFAPHSALRRRIVPHAPARTKKAGPDEEGAFAHRHRAMTWAQRLRRVFNIDIETCERCGGAMKIMACIQDPAVIRKLLRSAAPGEPQTQPHPARGPPSPADGRSSEKKLH